MLLVILGANFKSKKMVTFSVRLVILHDSLQASLDEITEEIGLKLVYKSGYSCRKFHKLTFGLPQAVD